MTRPISFRTKIWIPEAERSYRPKSCRSSTHLPDLIVSERGAIAIKAKGVYQFYECDTGRAAVVFVSEILTAVTTELTRTGSIGDRLTTVLTSAVDVHSKFLQANKKQILDDLPIKGGS